jgi:hypothetical protein
MNTRNSLSKTLVPSNRRRAVTAKQPVVIRKQQQQQQSEDSKKNFNFSGSKTISSHQPRSSVASRNEYEKLINDMQNALNNKNDCKSNSLLL